MDCDGALLASITDSRNKAAWKFDDELYFDGVIK